MKKHLQKHAISAKKWATTRAKRLQKPSPAALGLLGLVIAFNILIPTATISQANPYDFNVLGGYGTQEPVYGLPEIEEFPRPAAVYTFEARVTAYNSEPSQTWGNPFITASGTHVQDGTVAANCLPFGTKIRIYLHNHDRWDEEYKEFTVEDRMAARMGCEKVDIWEPLDANSKTFGSQPARIEVLETSPELALAGLQWLR